MNTTTTHYQPQNNYHFVNLPTGNMYQFHRLNTLKRQFEKWQAVEPRLRKFKNREEFLASIDAQYQSELQAMAQKKKNLNLLSKPYTCQKWAQSKQEKIIFLLMTITKNMKKTRATHLKYQKVNSPSY